MEEQKSLFNLFEISNILPNLHFIEIRDCRTGGLMSGEFD